LQGQCISRREVGLENIEELKGRAYELVENFSVLINTIGLVDPGLLSRDYRNVHTLRRVLKSARWLNNHL